VEFTAGLDSGLGAIVCIEIGSDEVVDNAIGRGADVAADVGPDPAVVVACEPVVALLEEVEEAEAMVVDRASLVDEVVPVGRIQNCRLQNPKFASAFTSPKASTALMANGASQSGSQVTAQSSVFCEYPAGPSQRRHRATVTCG